MIRCLFVLCLAFPSATLLAPQAAAQEHFPVSTEVSFGFRVGHGGTYASLAGAAIDAVLGYRLRDIPAGTLILALNTGLQVPMGVDICRVLPGGECAPELPAFLAVGALLGVQRGSGRTASARILVGPTYYDARGGGSALGLQGRIDAATPPWLHTAVVASLRHTVLPSFQGEALGITSFGLGLRIQ